MRVMLEYTEETLDDVVTQRTYVRYTLVACHPGAVPLIIQQVQETEPAARARQQEAMWGALFIGWCTQGIDVPDVVIPAP